MWTIVVGGIPGHPGGYVNQKHVFISRLSEYSANSNWVLLNPIVVPTAAAPPHPHSMETSRVVLLAGEPRRAILGNHKRSYDIHKTNMFTYIYIYPPEVSEGPNEF